MFYHIKKESTISKIVSDIFDLGLGQFVVALLTACVIYTVISGEATVLVWLIVLFSIYVISRLDG